MKISNKKLGLPGIKLTLGVLTAMLLAGITFSVVQIATAGVTGPHDPGHAWSLLDKPADCSVGNYVSGATDSGWVCTPLPATASYWTRQTNNTLYPTGNPNPGDVNVVIGDFRDQGAGIQGYLGATVSVKGQLGTAANNTIGVDSRAQVAGGYFQNTNIYDQPTGADAFLGYNNSGISYGIYAGGKDAGGYFFDSDSSIYTRVASAGYYSIYGNGAIVGLSKSFIIDHPTKPGMKLVHASIEGPEVAVYYRGEGQLLDGRAEVQLPDYFEALVRDEDRTVLLTPKFDEENEQISQLAASAVLGSKFIVKSTDNNNPSQKFYWEVKAVRDDISILVAEQPAENFPELSK